MSVPRKNIWLVIVLVVVAIVLLDIANVRTDLINGFRDGWNAARSD